MYYGNNKNRPIPIPVPVPVDYILNLQEIKSVTRVCGLVTTNYSSVQLFMQIFPQEDSIYCKINSIREHMWLCHYLHVMRSLNVTVNKWPSQL